MPKVRQSSLRNAFVNRMENCAETDKHPIEINYEDKIFCWIILAHYYSEECCVVCLPLSCQSLFHLQRSVKHFKYAHQWQTTCTGRNKAELNLCSLITFLERKISRGCHFIDKRQSILKKLPGFYFCFNSAAILSNLFSWMNNICSFIFLIIWFERAACLFICSFTFSLPSNLNHNIRVCIDELCPISMNQSFARISLDRYKCTYFNWISLLFLAEISCYF